MAALSGSFCEAEPLDIFCNGAATPDTKKNHLVGCVAVASAFSHFTEKSAIVRTVDYWLGNFIFHMKKQSSKFVIKDRKMTSQYEFSVKNIKTV